MKTPHLNNSLSQTLHLPLTQNIYIWTDDPELPALYFDPLINLISLRGFTLKNVSHEDSIWWNGADGDDFKLPEDVAPFLVHRDFENDPTADGIAL